MANSKQIDNAFRLAGYEYGRPTLDRVPNTIYPFDLGRIADLFSDDVVNKLLANVGENPANRTTTSNQGFPFLMAAEILSVVAATDFTSDGRNVSLTSITQGGLTSTFESSETYKRNLNSRIKQLRAEGRRLTDVTLQQIQIMPPVAGLNYDQLKASLLAGEHISIEADDDNENLTINAPYNVREQNGFGDAVYETLKLVLKTANNVIVSFNDAREEIKFNAELDRETLHAPLKQTLEAGENITITPDDSNNTITISAEGGDGGVLNSETATIASGNSKTYQLVPNTENLPDGTVFRISVSYPRNGITEIDSILLKDNQFGGTGLFRWDINSRPTRTINLFFFRGAGLSIRVDGADDPFEYTYLVAWGDEATVVASSGGAPTQSQVYTQTKKILLPGAGITIANTDGTNTQDIGLNVATLQSNVILSANQDVAATQADRGKLLAVDKSDQTKLELVDAPSGGGSQPPNKFNASWVFSDGTAQPIDYLRANSMIALFGDVDSLPGNTKRKDIRLALDGYIHGLTNVNQIRSIIFAGQTIRANTAMEPGEYVRDGYFSLYGTFTNTQLDSVIENSSGSVRIAITYNTGTLNSVNRDIAWLTKAQSTALPLAPYIPAEAIIGGTKFISAGEVNFNSSSGTNFKTIIPAEHYDRTGVYFIRGQYRDESLRPIIDCHDSLMIFSGLSGNTNIGKICDREVEFEDQNSNTTFGAKVRTALTIQQNLWLTAYYLG